MERFHPAPFRPRLVPAGPTAPAPYIAPASRPTAATFWRRRLVALTIFAVASTAAIQALGWFGGVPLNAAEPASAPAATATYVVQPGDTLWSIARSIKPDGEIRPLVDRLAGQVGGRPLQAGDRLVVP